MTKSELRKLAELHAGAFLEVTDDDILALLDEIERLQKERDIAVAALPDEEDVEIVSLRTELEQLRDLLKRVEPAARVFCDIEDRANYVYGVIYASDIKRVAQLVVDIKAALTESQENE